MLVLSSSLPWVIFTLFHVVCHTYGVRDLPTLHQLQAEGKGGSLFIFLANSNDSEGLILFPSVSLHICLSCWHSKQI